MIDQPIMQIIIPNHEPFCIIEPDFPKCISIVKHSNSARVSYYPTSFSNDSDWDSDNRIAYIIEKTVPNTDNSIGSSYCSNCSNIVDKCDIYCRSCGRLLFYKKYPEKDFYE